MKAIMVRGQVKGRPPHKKLEFHFLGGPLPYLRIGIPDVRGSEEYVGAVDGRDAIKKLRDYLTRALRETP